MYGIFIAKIPLNIEYGLNNERQDCRAVLVGGGY
jgi:hypothetical protein